MGNKSSASVHKYVQPRTVIKTVDDVTKFSASEQSAQLLAYIDALTASAHCTKQYKCDLTPVSPYPLTLLIDNETTSRVFGAINCASKGDTTVVATDAIRQQGL